MTADSITEPCPEDYTLSPCGRLGSRTSVGQIEGAHLGEYATDDDALAAIRADMDASGFYPAVWNVSDHGNWSAVNMTDENGSAE